MEVYIELLEGEDVHKVQQLHQSIISINPISFPSLLQDLRGHAFSVKTFLISDIFRVCKLKFNLNVRGAVTTKEDVLVAGRIFNNREAIRCIGGVVVCLW